MGVFVADYPAGPVTERVFVHSRMVVVGVRRLWARSRLPQLRQSEVRGDANAGGVGFHPGGTTREHDVRRTTIDRCGVAAGIAVTAAVLAAVPASAAATGGWPAWGGDATGEFRTGRLDEGEFVWTNGVLQSRGANADGVHHEEYWGQLASGAELPIEERDDVDNHLTWGAFGVDRWATDGDQELPRDDEAYPEYSGEVNELRLAVDDDELFVRWLFTSFPSPDAQIATLTIGDGTVADWPHGAGVTAPWTFALTATGTAGSVTTAGQEPRALDEVGGTVRVTDHAIEARLPLAILPDGPWTLRGGAGLADPSDPSSYWAVPAGSATDTDPGSGASLADGSPVWSLLFAVEDTWVFTARAEGDLLADGDVTDAVVTVDPADLAAGITTDTPATSGRLARQYVSAYDFGDGITKGDPEDLPAFLMVPPEVPLDDAGRSFEYTGRLQPYGMVVPEAYHDRTEPWPLVVYLHGLNNYYYEPFGLVQGLDEELAEHGYLFASLLGRGDLSYRGRGELDVREALADIMARYDVHPDRVHLMGHSMGSIGTHNIVTRNPDLFASASPAQITASDDLLVNLMHVPWMTAGGLADPLDPAAQSELDTHAALADLGYDSTTWIHTLKTHENSSVYDLLPASLDLYDRTRRVADPGTFTYRRLPDDDDPDIGVLHDRAYAASDLRFTDDSVPQQVDVTSFAIPHAPLDPANAVHTDEMVDPGGISARTAARRLTSTPAFGPPHQVQNAADVTLANVSSLTLDMDRLALEPMAGLVVDVTTDTPATLRLDRSPTDASRVEIDGAPVPSAVTTDGIVVDLPEGDHQVRLVAAVGEAPAPTPSSTATPAPDEPATPTRAPLPATGGGLAIAAFGLAVLVRRGSRRD